MKQSWLFSLVLLACGCGPSSHSEGGHHHRHHAPGDANAYMHQSSTEELIERFESPERDAYQQPGKVLGHLGDLHGLTIMDLGAGSVYFSFKLAQAGAHVIAADVDSAFQAHIAQRMQEEETAPGSLTLRQIPFDNPGLIANEVDKVLLVNTYHHIEDRPTYFSQVLQGLKPGGELVVIDYFKKKLPVGPPEGHKVSRQQVQEELQQAGFSRFEVDTTLLDYQFILRAGT